MISNPSWIGITPEISPEMNDGFNFFLLCPFEGALSICRVLGKRAPNVLKFLKYLFTPV